MTGAGGRTAQVSPRVAGGWVPGALGAVLCALAVVPVWGYTLDRTSFGQVWTAEPVWGADPWWSLALLLGVVACALAVLGRRPRARLFTAAALAVWAVQFLTLLHRAWNPGLETMPYAEYVAEQSHHHLTQPVSLLPLLGVPVAAVVLATGLAVRRRYRADRWGAAAVGVAAAVVVSGAALVAVHPAPGLQVVVDAGGTGGIHGHGVDGPLEGWLDGPVREPGRPGWTVWAVAVALLLLLVHLRRGRDGAAVPGGRPGGDRRVRVTARGREAVALAFVGAGAAVVALALSPGWAAWWVTLDAAIDGVGAETWWWEPSPWSHVSLWWLVGAGLGVAGSASAVRAVRGARHRRVGEDAGTGDADHRVARTADRAVLTSWAAAAVAAVHAAWALSPDTGQVFPGVVAALLGAQAIAVRLIGPAPVVPAKEG